MLASMIGMTVGFNGLATLGGILTVEREDGTLLRAKATPNGMTGYLSGCWPPCRSAPCSGPCSPALAARAC